MAIAKAQIAELYKVLRQFVGSERAVVEEFLGELATTQAYKWNQSFRETVMRLKAYHEFLLGEEKKRR